MAYKDPEYMKKWHAANKDYIAAYNKKDYAQRAKQADFREQKRMDSKQWYDANREKGLAARKKYYDANRNFWRDYARRTHDPVQHRAYHLKKKYAIDLKDYEELLSKQQGLCAICGTDSPGGRGKFFAVDHDHGTGRVRGLLCLKCNRGLGLFQDQSSILERAATYLRGTP